MGRNADIKRYDATPAGQPMELFASKRSRMPIVAELLQSPWILRASDLMRRDGAAAKRVEEPVQVEWDSERQRPTAFVRDQRRFRIDAVIQVWSADRSWWDPRRRVSRRFVRVLAQGGIYDLTFDRQSGVWLLTGIQD